MNATLITENWRQSRLVPMLLITIGSVLLGANLGLISRDAPHALLHLSPAVLILVGVELLLRRGASTLALQSTVIALVVAVAVIAPDLAIPAGMSVQEHLH